MKEWTREDQQRCAYNHYAECPHCGYKEWDAWEWELEDGDSCDADCGQCGRKYNVSASVSTQWSTRPIEVMP
jgi:transcription elongation factor Elf1